MNRTVTLKSVYEAVVRRHGMDPLGDAITQDTARAICEHIMLRAKDLWTMWDWPWLTLTEERAYRAPWNSLVQYRRVGANGLPDEVYYIPNATYYQVNATAISDPPLGVAPPSGLTNWIVFTPTNTFVDRDQLGMRPMGIVRGVYRSDPSLNGCCSSPNLCLNFRPTADGVTICDGPATTVFVQYVIPDPEYTMVPYVGGKAYVAGDHVYYSDGNCYRCIVATSTQLPTNSSFWVMEMIPEVFGPILKARAYADCLRETFTTGEDQVRLARAALVDQEADGYWEAAVDDMLAQGQKHHWMSHRWPQVSWRYDGTIQWPTTGWSCTRPWTGNIVYPLTGMVVGPMLPSPPLVLAADTGTTPLIIGQGYVDVVFSSAKPNNDWVFTELRVLNTTDSTPLNIWPGIVSSKTTTGFRLQLNGIPDTGNYVLQWTVSEVNTAPQPATTYGLSGPSSGAPGIPATFTVHLPSSTTVPGVVIVTPSDGGAGGTFTPSSVGLTTAGPSATFTYTATSAGTKTISVTNNGGLIDPPSFSFAAAYATMYSLVGPSGGDAGTPSTNFTVALLAGTSVPSAVTVTPHATGGGTFTPTTVSITTGAPSATFTYTPASSGPKTISVTNSGGLTDPTALTYTATSSLHLLNSLISYWKMDEATSATTLADSVGSNPLTGYTSNAFAGMLNNAQYWSGSSPAAQHASNASLQVTGDFTFSFWARIDGGGVNICKGDVIGSLDYAIGMCNAIDASGTMSFRAGSLASVNIGGYSTPAFSWHHVVAWYDSSDNKLRLRMDDTTTFVGAAGGSLVQTTALFEIGNNQIHAGSGVSLNGMMDEVGFWKRKLTPLEITTLYGGGTPPPLSSFTT